MRPSTSIVGASRRRDPEQGIRGGRRPGRARSIRRPVGKPWPSDYRISDQGILNIAFGARNKRDLTEVYRRTVEAGARPNHAPIHLPGAGVVYVNDAQGFSVELLWMKPGKSDRDWGFEPLLIAKRPPPDNRRIERSVRIAAPIERVSVIADHEDMAAWCGFDQVKLTREGVSPDNGYGAERSPRPPGNRARANRRLNPPHGYRYRVIDGSPLVCHQGEVQLTPAGNETELRWTVRFRPKIPGSGALLQRVLGNALGRVVNETLRSYAERRQRA
jgi:hypothetical protein